MEIADDFGTVSPEMKDSLEYKHMLEFLKEDNITGAYSCLRRIQDIEGEVYKDAYLILSQALSNRQWFSAILSPMKEEANLTDEELLEKVERCVEYGAMEQAHEVMLSIVSEDIRSQAMGLFNPYKR